MSEEEGEEEIGDTGEGFVMMWLQGRIKYFIMNNVAVKDLCACVESMCCARTHRAATYSK